MANNSGDSIDSDLGSSEDGDDSDSDEEPLVLEGATEEADWKGDRALWNTTLFMVHASWYYEFQAATQDGDPGRVLEVMKVSRYLSIPSSSLIICTDPPILFLGLRVA